MLVALFAVYHVFAVISSVICNHSLRCVYFTNFIKLIGKLKKILSMQKWTHVNLHLLVSALEQTRAK